jgi:protein involved in polysaccharide export with SLBB domain
VVDLDDSTLSPTSKKPVNTSSMTPAAAAAAAAAGNSGSWVFLNGKWVQATLTEAGASATQPDGTPAPKKYIAQRTIRIRVRDLLSGNEKYNIVIRPGDVILVPAPNVGLVYMAGQINNPGAIALPPNGGLTLLRAIDSAGGLSSIAIPERIDLTRMIGTERQATIRLNGRAIAEQTQPDVYLKANDRINIGTNFWALPLAVVRNGFRVSYGFGFLIDRNFGNDIFGAPPDNRFGGTQ